MFRQDLIHRGSLRTLLFVVTASVPNLAGSQSLSGPTYLKHLADPVQQIFSKALVGYALDQKCRILNDADAADYEQRLNRAVVIFQGYVAAQQIVSGPDQAIGYTREMTLGSVRFAAVNACDAATTESVNSGYRTAQDFVPLLRELFEAPSRKQ